MEQQPLPLDLPPPATLEPRPRRTREDAATRRLRQEIRAALQLVLEFALSKEAPAPRAPAANEAPLVYLDMPRTRAECRGPGICPVFRCRHNLALRVKESGAIKVDGGGPGTTLRPTSHASARRIDHIVDIIIERAEALGTLCSLDLAEAGKLSIPEVARVLGVKDEIVRQEFLAAAHEIDIAEARARRQERAALDASRPTAPLVQIRRRP